VFLELDGDYLRTWGKEWWNHAPTRLVSPFYLEEGAQQPERRRIILLSHVLPSAFTLGYQECKDLPVRRIAGRDIDSIQDVVDAFAAAAAGSDPFVRVELYPNEIRAEIVLDGTQLAAQTERILAEYGIPAQFRLPERPLPPIE
jgi:hypothetical protein